MSHLKTRKPAGYSNHGKAWPKLTSFLCWQEGDKPLPRDPISIQAVKIPGHRALPPTSSSPCFFSRQPHLSRMACQPDGERKSSNHKSFGLWSCPSEPSRAWGPLPTPASLLPDPRRAAPHPFPLPGPRTEQAVCVGLAQLLQASQSKHKLEPQAQPGPAPQLHLAMGADLAPWSLLRRIGTLCLLTLAETQI